MSTQTRKGPAALADEAESMKGLKRHDRRGRPSLPAPGLVEGDVPNISDAMAELYGQEGVIPLSKPVTGRDLNLLRTRLGGITVPDACWLFGLQRNRWYQIVNSDAPLRDTSLAILARLYDTYPEMCPIKPVRRPEFVFHWMREVNPNIDQRAFSLMLGREKSAGHRWLKQGSAVSQKVQRLFSAMVLMMITGLDPKEVLEPIAIAEASSRGLNLSRDGVWTAPKVRTKTKKPSLDGRTREAKLLKKQAAEKAAAEKDEAIA